MPQQPLASHFLAWVAKNGSIHCSFRFVSDLAGNAVHGIRATLMRIELLVLVRRMCLAHKQPAAERMPMSPKGLIGPIAGLLLASPAWASDGWVVATAKGSVLALVGNQWQELRPGDSVSSGVIVRTLQAGRAVLRRTAETLQLEANTTIRATLANGTGAVEQYAGTLSIEESGNSYRLVTPTYVAVAGPASFVSRIGGRNGGISVQSGEVQVSTAGRHIRLVTGQTWLASGVDKSTSSSSGSTGVTATVTATGGTDGDSDNIGGKFDNGRGNGGTPGNGGQNGNAGLNGNGNGNSQK